MIRSGALSTASPHTPQNYCVVIAQKPLANVTVSYLQQFATWEVIEAQDAWPLQTNKIYLASSAQPIFLQDGHICFATPDQSRPEELLDDFFESLAKNSGACAIGLILGSGGRDGVRGIEAIGRQRGLVFSGGAGGSFFNYATFSSLRIYDLTTPTELIGQKVSQYIENVRLVRALPEQPVALPDIFRMLAEKSQVHFDRYKPSTLQRRLQKRIESLNLSGVAEYYQHLRENPIELDVLFKLFLVRVTEFFRDELSFEVLKDPLLQIINRNQTSGHLRLWSVGCATGEEAYSLAILLAETLGDRLSQYQIRIFATDIDQDALRIARRGRYTEKAISALPEAFRERYFIQKGSEFEIIREVRQMVNFARHNIGNDPPFVHMDLISCRNLLIYFSPELQNECIATFQYALQENGYLLLGKSENITLLENLFERIHGRTSCFVGEILSPCAHIKHTG
ncbi:MAG: hypothetical protein HC880_14605 [Bacteroidia bacterium]|nr:hypothetical protein [Bacteroidia bacterium]